MIAERSHSFQEAGRAAGRESGPLSPRPSPIDGIDLGWLLAVNAILVALMWLRHGGADRIDAPGGGFTAIGDIAALYGTLALLALLVLISRVPWIERRYGMDRLNGWHRWTGFAATLLLVGHALFTTLGYAAGLEGGFQAQLGDFIGSSQWMLSAIVALALILGVSVTSIRLARRHLNYETWWFVHFYAYLAVALSFMHQVVAGVDFIDDPWARWYWIALYLMTMLLLVGFRFGTPLFRMLVHDLRVADIRWETDDIVTLTLTGRHLSRLRVEAGQFFILRFVRADSWWKAHPFSLSARPDGKSLRFTIKTLGDDTSKIANVPVGSRVAAEGPYGVFTAARAAKRKILLIGAGIGITPIRAVYEDIDREPGDVDLLYRARSRNDAALLGELNAIHRDRGFGLDISFSNGFGDIFDEDEIQTRGSPFQHETLLARYPDIAERDIYICGPPSLLAAARTGLKLAGVSAGQIHTERFSY
jgi:predicted ferric reductase